MIHRIYKIVDKSQWEAAVAAGEFRGAEVDLEDGYIHLSTARQVKETAERHFAGRSGLLLVAVDAERLGEALRWEPSRGGELFPHLYAALSPAAVIEVTPLPLRIGGGHEFPESL